MITLRPLTDENRAVLEALRIEPAQERFVNTVSEALLAAAEEPGGRALQSGLSDGDTRVGFGVISDEVDGPEYIAHYLWKLLIDRDRQRQGCGTAALDLVSTYF